MSRVAIIPPAYPNQEAQDVENHRAIAALSELVENAITVAENYLAYTEGRLPTLAHKGASLEETNAEFCTRYRHEQPCGWDEDRVMSRCNQMVTKDQIIEISERPPMDVGNITTSLHHLNTTEKLPRGRFLVYKDYLSVLRRHQGPDAVLSLPDTLTALYDINFVDATATIREELSETDAAKDKYLSQVQEAHAVYNQAIARGDVVEVERAHRHLIAARYEYVVLCAKRLHLLNNDANNEDGAHFAEELKRVQEEAEAAVRQFEVEKTVMKNAIQQDIGNCDKAKAEEQRRNDAAVETYAAKEKKVAEVLASVVKRKQSIIEELRKKALELRDLMEQQKAIIQEGIDAKRTEEERFTTFNEFVNIEEQHRNRLQKCMDYYTGCDPVVKAIDEYLDQMIQKLPKDNFKNAIEAISDEEAAVFMEAYKVFVFVCGELTVKKAHRLDTLERQGRLTKHNRDSAMDSLDPNLQNYRLDLEDIVEQMKAVEGVINALNATQDAGEQVFESVEEPVRSMYKRREIQFVHPLQEFGIKSVDDRTRFVNHSMQYVESEEREVTHKKSEIAEMKQIVQQENTALEKIVAAQRRPSAAIDR